MGCGIPWAAEFARGKNVWYNVHAGREHLGVSLAGQTATGIQLPLNRKTSRLVLKLWYNIRVEREYLGVSLAGSKA